MVQRHVPHGTDAAQGQRLSSHSPSTRSSTSLSRCGEHVSGRRIRGSQQDPHNRQSSISLGTGRCVALRSRRDSSQQDRLEQADRREAQNERASKLERGRRAAAQLQESRDTLFDGTPEQKVPSHRDAEHQPHSASKSRTSQTDMR